MKLVAWNAAFNTRKRTHEQVEGLLAEFRADVVQELYGFTYAPAQSVVSLFADLLHRTSAPTAAEINGRMQRPDTGDETEWTLEVRRWVQETLLSRYRGPGGVGP